MRSLLDSCRWIIGCSVLLLTSGCVRQPENQVVVYCALDQEFAAPIFGAFTRSQDPAITPQTRFDVESTKTVGLVNRILAEKSRPVCDVFWNNEILHTVRLQQAGLLQPRTWKIPADWPADLRASDGTWCGFAARARVLLVNRQLLADSSLWPQSVLDLTDPKWKGNCAVARPLFGTTATHFVVLDQTLGSDSAEKFYRATAENAVVLAGNKQVAQAVATGQVAWGLTDTDDAIVEQEAGLPVALVWPDQQPGQAGTLRIPNTVAILKDAPHPRAAEVLADFLVSPLTEERLAMGDSAQIPVGSQIQFQPRILPAEPVRWMQTNFEQAAARWDTLAPRLAELYP